MNVEVHLFATLAAYLPDDARGDRVVLEVPDGTTVGQAIGTLKIPSGLDCLVVVNGRDVEAERVLIEGDVLSLFPPLAGGC